MSSGKGPLLVAAIVVAVFVVSLLYSALDDESAPLTYPYSQLIADAAARRVMDVRQQGLELTVTLADGAQQRTTVASESVNVYAEVCAAAGKELGSCSIRYEVVPASQTGSIVSLLITSLLPVLLIGSFIYFMMRQAQQRQNQGPF
jgi:ATP-dependent Zn protease